MKISYCCTLAVVTILLLGNVCDAGKGSGKGSGKGKSEKSKTATESNIDFNKIDTNKNGVIENSEIDAASKADRDALKKQFDKNKDGKFSKEELAEIQKAQNRQRKRQQKRQQKQNQSSGSSS